MAVLVWSDRDGSLGNSIRSGRRVALSAEEYRPEAEALDKQLDAVLDMAWQALNIITRRKDGKPRFNSFEQVWVLGRAVYISEILRHEAMRGEVRTMLWQALTAKAWYGIRHDGVSEPRWRELIPSRNKKWQTQPTAPKAYEFLDIGYWLREQQLHDAGEVFGWRYVNAQDLRDRSSLRSIELRQTVLLWLRRQSPSVREELAKPKIKGQERFSIIPKALQKRFPASGPGSALLPQHYPPDELRLIVCDVLDAARDAHFI
ncbi:MAG: hypothetical protein OXN94_02505 [Chloroflexota bacterium]|nr:hypothetical protein [Chloroflexota bacterium]